MLLAAGGLWLSNASYPAGEKALAALQSSSGVTVTAEDNMTVFMPEEVAQGLIFYPGGFVEHTAYAPLLRSLAEEGWLCVLTEMPFDLAVLNMNAADGIRERFPQVDSWAIGGHSLGGAIAASYAAGHAEDFDALVLLAAYATEDLNGTDMTVYSIYGSEDQVLNRDKYAQYRKNLPANTIEVVLEGGNHAQFGDYGHQKGDGTAALSPEEQQQKTVAVLNGR